MSSGLRDEYVCGISFIPIVVLPASSSSIQTAPDYMATFKDYSFSQVTTFGQLLASATRNMIIGQVDI